MSSVAERPLRILTSPHGLRRAVAQRDAALDPDLLAPILGEYAWHSVTRDPTIQPMSEAHARELRTIIDRHLPARSLSILEVGAYAHYTGDLLARDGHDVVLLDIAASTLRLGAREAAAAGLDATLARRVAADFHALPFEDGAFDLVFIASALHHTWRWEVVFDELARVTDGGGVLVFLNEPTARQLCTYGFRCNRPGEATELESELSRLGVLRLVSEPYIGSRPESLFGMVENQEMPLASILERAAGVGEILSIGLDAGSCMTWLEHGLWDERALGAEALTERYTALVAARLDEARAFETPQTRGIGFVLPTVDAVRPLIARAANRLCDPGLAIDAAGRDRALAETFGGALRLEVRRHPAAPRGSSHLTADAQTVEGVEVAYPTAIRELLLEGALPLPDLQGCTIGEVAAAFPPSQWRFERNGDDLAALVLDGTVGTITIPRPAGDDAPALILLRAHLSVGRQAYRVTVGPADGAPGSTFDAHANEGVLLRATVPAGTDAEVRLEPLVPSPEPLDGRLLLSYVVALRLPPELTPVSG